MKLVLATKNKGKIKEYKSIIPEFEFLIWNWEMPEEKDNFYENALIKAKYVSNFVCLPVIAEDSGLCIEALDGFPGPFSNRIAKTTEERINIVLSRLSNVENRRAYFISVICFIYKDKTFFFEGKCYGKIAIKPKGSSGFGYDPIFIPDGFDKTFAEDIELKNKLSHRKRAIENFKDFINKTLPGV